MAKIVGHPVFFSLGLSTSLEGKLKIQINFYSLKIDLLHPTRDEGTLVPACGFEK